MKVKIGRVIFGGLFLLLGIGTILVVPYFVNEERKPLMILPRFNSTLIKTVRLGEQVVIEGKLSEKNNTLFDHFVIGCEESYSDHEWQNKKEFNQPFLLTFGEGTNIIVHVESPCPRGNFTVIPHPQETNLRWVGFEAKAKLTVVGKITSVDPLSLSATRHYGGTRMEYAESLRFSDLFIYFFGSLFAFFGSMLVYRGLK